MQDKLIFIMQGLCAFSCFWQFVEYKALQKYFLSIAEDKNFLIKGHLLKLFLSLGIVASIFLFFDMRASLILLGLYFMMNSLLKSSFNGGSDYMTLLVVMGLALISILPHPKLQQMVLLYIAIQTVFSYTIAGLVKAKKQKWWTGVAIAEILNSKNYSVPLSISKMTPNKALMMGAGLFILIFELSFPLCLLSLTSLKIYLVMAFLFHLLNFYTFGLNRFVWSWLASYPSLFILISIL